METRSSVSNPYTLTVNQNYSVSANIKQDIPDYHLYIRANIIKWKEFIGNNQPSVWYYGYDGVYVERKQNYYNDTDTVNLLYLYSSRSEASNPHPASLPVLAKFNHGRRTKLIDVDIIVDNGDRASLTLEYVLDQYDGYTYGTSSLIFFNNVGQYANFYIRFRDDSGFVNG